MLSTLTSIFRFVFVANRSEQNAQTTDAVVHPTTYRYTNAVVTSSANTSSEQQTIDEKRAFNRFRSPLIKLLKHTQETRLERTELNMLASAWDNIPNQEFENSIKALLEQLGYTIESHCERSNDFIVKRHDKTALVRVNSNNESFYNIMVRPMGLKACNELVEDASKLDVDYSMIFTLGRMNRCAYDLMREKNIVCAHSGSLLKLLHMHGVEPTQHCTLRGQSKETQHAA